MPLRRPVRRPAERRPRRFEHHTARVAPTPRAVLFFALRPFPFTFPFPFTASPRRSFMKITVNTRKPRNPLVALARFRRAGSHQIAARGSRQQAARSLQRELERMNHSP